MRAVDPPLVRCSGVTKSYDTPDGPHPVLGPFDLAVPRGQFLAVLGPSGCGKSTLLRMIAGLTAADGGVVEYDGSPVRGPQTQVGMAFQSAALLEWMTVLDNVRLQGAARPIPRAEVDRRARELLELVGLEPAIGARRPSQLSGGQQQRVSIARALLHEPDLVLLDEPFGALDAITRDQIANDLSALWRGLEATVLLVTHSIEEAVFLADRVVVMSSRPGVIRLDLSIELPVRDVTTRDSAAFHELTGRLRAAIEH
ncbi:MAG: ABC transporter ATP-binding protein [Microbacteriaceae bacterium]